MDSPEALIPRSSTMDEQEVRTCGSLSGRMRHLWRWRYVALSLASLFAVRTYWQMEPGPATAAAYWSGLLVVLSWSLHRFSLMKTSTGVLLLSGFALNAIVTLANGGFMPIPGDEQHGVYEPLTDDTKLSWLADVLPLKSSIGDWFVGAGLAALAWTVVRRRHNSELDARALRR